MADKILKMRFEADDNASIKAQKLKKNLKELGRTSEMKDTLGWLNDVGGEMSTLGKNALGVAEAIGPIGLGLAAMAIGATKLTQSLLEVGRAQRELQHFATSINLPTEKIRQFTEALKFSDVNEDGAKAALAKIADELTKFKANIQSDFGANLFALDAKDSGFSDRIRKENPAEAIQELLGKAEPIFKQSGGNASKMFLDSFVPGLGDIGNRVFEHGFGKEKKELAELARTLVPQDKSLTQSVTEFDQSTIRLHQNWTNLVNEIEPKFKFLVDALSGMVTSLNWIIEHAPGGSAWKTDPNAPPAPAPSTNRYGHIHRVDPAPEAPASVNRYGQRHVAPAPEPRGRYGLLHKSSYEEGSTYGGLLQKASYEDGDKSSSQTSFDRFEKSVRDGTTLGVLTAFQLLGFKQGSKNGDEPGLTNASFETGSPGSGGAAPGGGGRRGFAYGPGPGGGVALSGEKGGLDTKATEEYIRKSALARGIDPAVALKVWGHEGRGAAFGAGDGGSSFGPFQLHMGGINPAMPHAGLGDDFKKETGLDPKDPKNTRQEIEWALNHVRKRGWGAWMGAKAEHIYGFQGVGALPPGAETGLSREFGALGGETAQGDASDGLKRARAGVGQFAALGKQCVDLVRTISGDRSLVTSWQRGDAADSGALKPGTHIATFLDRQGRVSDRYAGGGIGTPGAHLDHAAVFDHYLMQAGKRIGMAVLEQDQNHRIHPHEYMFGDGYGERNGSNYFAIKRNGQYLGGANNPMNSEYANRSIEPKSGGRFPQANGEANRSDVHVHLHQDGSIKRVNSTAKNGMQSAKLHRWDNMRRPSETA